MTTDPEQLEDLTLKKARLRQQIAELDAWLGTLACKNELAATQRQLDDVNAFILGCPPVTSEDIALLMSYHGKRSLLIESLTHFEDVRAVLQTDLLKIEETESEIALKTLEPTENDN